jgi:DNA-binding NarL/FixJ family response regulator
MIESEPAWRDFLAALDDFYPAAGRATRERAFAGLTARETQVLELMAQGLDNAQIAARLTLAEKTVRNNVTQIFDKIEVETRAQAIVRAREAGLGARPAK